MADILGRNADEVSYRWRGKADRIGDRANKWGDRYRNIGRLEEKALDEFADSHDGIGEPGGRKKKPAKKNDSNSSNDTNGTNGTNATAPAAAAKLST
jgi:hypothetical protein